MKALQQIVITEIPPPPPPPPEKHLLAELQRAYDILQALHFGFENKMPNNAYMAMAYLHVEIVARGIKP